MDKKTLRNDLILIISLLIVAVIALVVVNVNANRTNLVATISVQDDVVEKIDLSKNEEKDYYITFSPASVNTGKMYNEDNAYYDNALTFMNYLLLGNL